ncbi:hypothetical protein KKA03_06585 [archaeon]|nr:hypothetical protein [archaeon]
MEELHEKRKIVLKIGGKNIPMNRFVMDFFKATILAMVKKLKKSELKEGDIVEIRMLVDSDDL